MRVQIALCSVAVCLGLGSMVMAQDAVKVDPKHYTVVSENDHVRILKVHYGAHEKSVTHSHPNLAVVFLNDSKGTFTFPEKLMRPLGSKASQARGMPGSSTDRATASRSSPSSTKLFPVITTSMRSQPSSCLFGKRWERPAM